MRENGKKIEWRAKQRGRAEKRGRKQIEQMKGRIYLSMNGVFLCGCVTALGVLMVIVFTLQNPHIKVRKNISHKFDAIIDTNCMPPHHPIYIFHSYYTADACMASDFYYVFNKIVLFHFFMMEWNVGRTSCFLFQLISAFTPFKWLSLCFSNLFLFLNNVTALYSDHNDTDVNRIALHWREIHGIHKSNNSETEI